MQRGSGLRWRAGKGGWAAMLAIVGLATWLLLPTASRGPIAADPNDLVTDNTYFFRLTAKYLHGDEPVDFDIVVGCGVRFTAYRGTSIEHDVFIQDPWFFVRRTRDGGAVLQNVPNACHFETTDNGQVPKDLLPGAVWFDDATDLSLGIAYVTEDAFENPNSRLKFHRDSFRSACDGDKGEPVEHGQTERVATPDRLPQRCPISTYGPRVA